MQKQTHLEFSRQDTAALKGIAIMMMLAHHLFSQTERYVNYFIYYTFDDEFNITARMAQYAKMCVPIFILLSAYGLTLAYDKWRKEERSPISFALDRYASLMAEFLPIFVLGLSGIVLLGGNLASVYGAREGSWISLVLDGLGLAELFHTPSANMTWWYMTFAILQVCLLPVFVSWVRKHGAVSLFLFWGVVLAGQFTYMLLCFSVSVLGIYLAHTRGFDKVRDWKPLPNPVWSKALKFLLYLAALALTVILCEELPKALKNNGQATGTLYGYWAQGCFAVVLCCMLYEFLLPFKLLRAVLGFLGRHSANIFFMHTFFYNRFWPDLFYDLEEPELIFLALLAATLAASLVLELLKALFRYNRLVEKLRRALARRMNKARLQEE